MLPPDFSAFFLANDISVRSTPGSPATFIDNGSGLGFHSVRASPAPSLPQSPNQAGMDGGRHSYANLAALGQQMQYHWGFDSAVNSAVQSATASPIVGAFNRRGLLNGMANLNMTQLPPTAISASTSFMGTQGTVGTVGNGYIDSVSTK
ncbi:hypothetical protein LPJ66_007042 [Kickxella alabastrina]|uniref:Uncharacterized protein n=1 Tax=Kickxella alabastrina TaxID=61397 RepID=A0ACC1IDU0_9FUNG|nr:hypothetical protein LPJ66_007042 [Kickxella alabastrina]